MEILSIAKILKENELLLGEIYQLCQQFFPTHKETFKLLQLEEESHAYMIDEVIKDISLNPADWKIGKLSIVSAQNVNATLKKALEEIKTEKVSAKYAITFAISMELSLSEKDFSHLFVTENPHFVSVFAMLADGFKGHYQKLLTIEKEIFASDRIGFDSLDS